MEQSLKLIVDYIHEKKGIWITPIPPMDARQTMIMNYMSQVAFEYFESNK